MVTLALVTPKIVVAAKAMAEETSRHFANSAGHFDDAQSLIFRARLANRPARSVALKSKLGSRFLEKPREMRRGQTNAGHTRQSRSRDLARYIAKHCAGGVRRNYEVEYGC